MSTRNSDLRMDRLEKAVEGIQKCFEEFRSPGSVEAHQQYIRQHTWNSTGVTGDKLAPSIGPNQVLHLPTFNGTDALGWLARADQYFFKTKTPPTSQVDIALLAIAGPAEVWKQLLIKRCPSLSWAKFAHELVKRFGDSVELANYEANNFNRQDGYKALMQEIRSTKLVGNHPLNVSQLMVSPQDNSKVSPIVVASVAKNQPKIPPTCNNNNIAILPSLPTVIAPLLSSCPPTTALLPITTSTIHPDVNTKVDNSAPLPVVVQQPTHISVLVPLPSPTNLPTPAVVTAPLRSSSAEIPQFQPPFFPLLQRTVPAAAAEQTPLMVQCVFLLVYGHIPLFSISPPVRKHEWEPPPNKEIGFNFELSLEGKAVLRVRQLIEIKLVISIIP